MCRLVGCLREAVEHGGWTVNVITFFAILVASFVKNIILEWVFQPYFLEYEHSTLGFTLKNE